MNKIIMGRGFGKTYNLIKLSAVMQIPIICAYNKDYIIKMSKELGVAIPKPLTAREVFSGGHRVREGDVLVDDAEQVLDYLMREMLGANIHTLTITSTDDSLNSMMDGGRSNRNFARLKHNEVSPNGMCEMFDRREDI